jgi:hypothetical protein
VRQGITRRGVWAHESRRFRVPAVHRQAHDAGAAGRVQRDSHHDRRASEATRCRASVLARSDVERKWAATRVMEAEDRRGRGDGRGRQDGRYVGHSEGAGDALDAMMLERVRWMAR